MKLLDVFPELPPVDPGRMVYTWVPPTKSCFFLSAWGYVVNYEHLHVHTDLKTRDQAIEGLYTWFHP